MQLWGPFSQQAEDSLNKFPISHDDPSKSAYKILYGKHNINTHPWAPPGCKAIVLEHPQAQTSWAPRGTDVWYTGPAKDHYQCYCMYIMDTKKY